MFFFVPAMCSCPPKLLLMNTISFTNVSIPCSLRNYEENVHFAASLQPWSNCGQPARLCVRPASKHSKHFPGHDPPTANFACWAHNAWERQFARYWWGNAVRSCIPIMAFPVPILYHWVFRDCRYRSITDKSCHCCNKPYPTFSYILAVSTMRGKVQISGENFIPTGTFTLSTTAFAIRSQHRSWSCIWALPYMPGPI